VSSRDDGARDERAEAEEQAWRDIVDHYGDQPVVPDDLLERLENGLNEGLPDGLTDRLSEGVADGVDPRPPVTPGDDTTTRAPGPAGGPEGMGTPADPFRFEPYADHFVPPPLPPPPDISTDRRLAWLGLVAPPVVLLIVVVLQYPLPGVITGALVVAFLGSFGYLVATMSRDPRDPDDDGARL
jgi:hypothetical protein